MLLPDTEYNTYHSLQPASAGHIPCQHDLPALVSGSNDNYFRTDLGIVGRLNLDPGRAGSNSALQLQSPLYRLALWFSAGR